jgi:hypothetical protein
MDELDSLSTTSLQPAAEGAPPKPQPNRHDRVLFVVYLAMGAMVAAFLTATSVAWWLGA